MKVVHIITGLDVGGAEMTLYKLLRGARERDFDSTVISLTDIGAIGRRIESLGIDVRALGMRRGTPSPLGIARLARAIRRLRPELVQTWMYHADLIGGFAARLGGRPPVVWNIRHTDLDRDGMKRTTRWTANACAKLSGHLSTRIICCSDTARRLHESIGYRADGMVVIPNGFDTDRFRPDVAARAGVRAELGIPAHSFLIGLIGRYDPQKDFPNFVEAAGRLDVSGENVRFVLCGKGVEWSNADLTGAIERSGRRDRFHLLGPRDDVPRLTAALDVATSSSRFGECISNTIGEAMACGIPCVVTDVGDSAQVVGETGRVVAAGDRRGLADAWGSLIAAGSEERLRLGAAARVRIGSEYSLAGFVDGYCGLYEQLRSARPSPPATAA